MYQHQGGGDGYAAQAADAGKKTMDMFNDMAQKYIPKVRPLVII